MLKLCYEGNDMLAVIDQIKGHSHYVMMDHENYLPFREEEFVYVLDDSAHESRLDTLPAGMPVFLMKNIASSIVRSQYPQLKFLPDLQPRASLPASICLLGTMDLSLRFTQLLLDEVPYCVGYKCTGYLLDLLKKSSFKTRFIDQFSPYRRQNLCLKYEVEEAEFTILFWDGSTQMLLDYRNQFAGSWPERFSVLSHTRRPKKDETMFLPYIGHLSRRPLLSRRQLKKYWQKILQFHAPSDVIK